MSLFKELKRRNVIRIAGIYAVVAWILMQVAGTLEESLKLPEWFDSVVTAGLMIGFPIALLLAWAFEMTPEGVKRTEELSEGGTVANSKMDSLILVGIVLVVGLVIWQQMNVKDMDYRLRGKDETKDFTIIPNTNPVIPAKAVIQSTDETIQANSIAVLPFADLSPNKDQEYFSDGMAEEILNVLVRVEALKVTSRTSAFQFKGQEIGIPEIAKQLKVRYVLEGSVRKAGNNLRITAQLIVAQGDKHLWSESYDRPLTTDNIFAIQDEISNAIVIALKEELNLDNISTIKVKQSTENLSAYELFLQARPLFVGRQQLDKADELLIEVIELDPQFAQALAMRAAIANLNAYYGFSTTSQEQADINSVELANRALKIDPNNVLALSTKAFSRLEANIRMRGQFDYAEIIKDLRKALVIEPKNTTTILWLGATYQILGFVEEAILLNKQCIDYEPRYRPCVSNYLSGQEYQGNYQIAADIYLDNIGTGLLSELEAPLEALVHLNQKIAFLMAINTPNFFKGWTRNEEIYQAYKNPQFDYSELINDAIHWASKKEPKPLSVDSILIQIGYEPNPKQTSGYEIFLYRPKDINSVVIKKYIKDTGVFSYWQKHGYPPQCRPLGEDDFECD